MYQRTTDFGNGLDLPVPDTTCRWLLHLNSSRSTELNGSFSASKSAAEISVPGQKQPVAYVRWADCFRLTTDIGTLIKTVAGR